MAAIKGDVGKIMFHNAAGTEADVSGVRSWSLSITKDTMETTVNGDTSKTFIGGLISGEGSAELIYDPSGNSDYQAFIDDVITTGTSMETCQNILLQAGARRVICLAFGRTQ